MPMKEYKKRAERIHRENGLLELLSRSSRVAASSFRRWLAPRYRAIAALYSHVLGVYDRTGLTIHADEVYRYSDGGILHLSRPRCRGDLPREFERVLGGYSFEQPFIAVINNGRLMRRSGLGATSGGVVLLDTARSRRDLIEHYLANHPRELGLLLSRQYGKGAPTPTDRLETACPLLTAPYSDGGGYAHWPRYMLAALQGVREYEQRTGRTVRIILGPDPPQFKLESLDLFGYDRSDIVYWNQSKEIRIKRLIVPSVHRLEQSTPYYRRYQLSDRYNVVSPAAQEWIRDTATQNAEITDTERFSNRIYISRADARRRQVINEDELLDVLQPLGFEPYQLSTLSFSDQVHLFSRADVIVAPHGAGLSNLVFASDCSIVELFGRLRRPMFYMIAEAHNLEYAMGVFEEEIDDDGLYVPPSALQELLTWVGVDEG